MKSKMLKTAIILFLAFFVIIAVFYYSSQKTSHHSELSMNSLNIPREEMLKIKNLDNFPTESGKSEHKTIPYPGPYGAKGNAIFSTDITKLNNSSYLIILKQTWLFGNGSTSVHIYKYENNTIKEVFDDNNQPAIR